MFCCLFHKEALNRSISDYSSTLLLNSSPPSILKQKQLERKQGYREDKYKAKDQECKLEISHKKEIDSIRKNKYQHAHRHTHWFCAMLSPTPCSERRVQKSQRKEGMSASQNNLLVSFSVSSMSKTSINLYTLVWKSSVLETLKH